MGLFKLTRGVHGWDQEICLDNKGLKNKTHDTLTDVENSIFNFYEREYLEIYTDMRDELVDTSEDEELSDDELETEIEYEWCGILDSTYMKHDIKNSTITVEHPYCYLIDGDTWYYKYTDDLIGEMIKSIDDIEELKQVEYLKDLNLDVRL